MIAPGRLSLGAKRLIDIVTALAGLVVLLPVCLLIAAAIRLDSPGSPLFVQRRVGRAGRGFPMLKFRSMIASAATEPPRPKDPSDPRVTRIGRVLRRTSLDELPQLVNVLLGHMSLVGPRPEVAAASAEWHRAALSVRPGMTGPMQVAGRAMLSPERRRALELEYAGGVSLWRDLRLLVATISVVITGRGAW